MKNIVKIKNDINALLLNKREEEYTKILSDYIKENNIIDFFDDYYKDNKDYIESFVKCVQIKIYNEKIIKIYYHNSDIYKRLDINII